MLTSINDPNSKSCDSFVADRQLLDALHLASDPPPTPSNFHSPPGSNAQLGCRCRDPALDCDIATLPSGSPRACKTRAHYARKDFGKAIAEGPGQMSGRCPNKHLRRISKPLLIVARSILRALATTTAPIRWSGFKAHSRAGMASYIAVW